MTAAEVVAMRSKESETESASETPRSDSTARTKSELEAIVESTTRSKFGAGEDEGGDSDECARKRNLTGGTEEVVVLVSDS